MNKQEFRSAYNKITLSEEFKAQAKAKLTEQFGKAEEKYPTENIIEEHPTAAIKLSPKRRSPWKAVAGIGTAAAVIGLGIWGGSMWLDRTQNPLDDQPTTEISETAETNEVVDVNTSDMELHRITFPAYYYDENSKLYNPAFDMEPFGLTIALPQEWDIVVPSGDDAMGVSMIFIMDGKECVGAIDCGIYKDLTGDEYGFDGVEYGHPDYHLMVLMGLMNTEYRVYPEGWDYDFINGEKQTGEWIMQPFGIDTVEDYAEIKTDGTMTAASCTLYRYMADPAYINTLFYGSGILAYNAYPHQYAYACFADVLDETLLNDIVSSIELTASSLAEHSITLPAYYDNETEYNKNIFSAVPFELDISLPEGWEIVVPKEEERYGYSAVDIMADGEIVGSIDFNVYDKYEGMAYGEPNYHQMVFNQLFLGSVINWNTDYTEVKTDGWLKSATCRIYHNASADGRNDDVEYTSGILAYKDDMQVYVNISFTSELDEKLHAEIAKSISITESTAGLAYRMACMMMENEEFNGLADNYDLELHVCAADTGNATYVIIAYYEQEKQNPEIRHPCISLYEIRNNMITGRLTSLFNHSGLSVYCGEDNLLLETSHMFDSENERYRTNLWRFYRETQDFEELALFEYNKGERGWENIIQYENDKEISLTREDAEAILQELTEGYTRTLSLYDIQEAMTTKTKCSIDGISAVIEKALNAMDKLPDEEPAPMPPNLYLDAEGAERPLLMGSYTWGEGLDEFHHDGWTIEDAVAAGKNYVYPAAWFEDAKLIIPESGKIISVTLHTNTSNYTELDFTADGAIILPNDPVGEHIQVTVEYPEGACQYLMTVDFPETSDPPAVTLNGKALTVGSYIWNGTLSGDHPRNADVWQMFQSGELLTVENESAIQLALPEGARLLDAICFGEDMETQLSIGCKESGEVRLPAAHVKSEGVIRLGVEYPDGSVSYWLGFRHITEDNSLTESITAFAADGNAFEMLQSENAWEDKAVWKLYQTEYVDLQLPDGAKVIDAHAVCKESIKYDLLYTEDGRVWMPFYDSMIINVTVSSSHSKRTYSFIHKGEGAPELIVCSEESGNSFAAFCSYWGWSDLVYEADDEGFGYEKALAMPENGGWLYNMYDVGEVQLTLPTYTESVYMEYYDENGTAHEIKPTEQGIYFMPDIMAHPAIIRVKLNCFEGSCEYWFRHRWSVCGSMEAESIEAETEELPEPPYVQLSSGDSTITPAMASCYWCYKDEELCADAIWIIDAEEQGIIPHIDAPESGSITVQISNSGTLQSAYIENESGLQKLEITPDGTIILPDSPIGCLFSISVAYSQGSCQYYFALDNYYNGE